MFYAVRNTNSISDFSKGIILPMTGDNQPINNKTVTPRQNSMGPNLDIPAARSSSSPIGCRIYTARVTLSDTFMAPVEEIYECLTVQQVNSRTLVSQTPSGLELSR